MLRLQSRLPPVGTVSIVVFTLAVGISASTALCTLLYATLWKPLTYTDSKLVVGIYGLDSQKRETGVSWQDLLDLSESASSISHIAGFRNRTWGITDTSGQPLEVVLSGMVTPDFFQTLGVVPQQGQGVLPEFRLPGSARVIWLSDSLWRARYGAAAEIVGQRVSLNDEPYLVAGVLPASFRFPIQGNLPDVYILLSHQDYCCGRRGRSLGGIAKLTPGASRDQVQSELAALSARLATDFPESNAGFTFVGQDLQTYLFGSRLPPLILIGVAVALLLLIAAANATAILLAHALGRTRDFALKVALGATATHLLKQQAAQGLLVGCIAAVAGVAGGWLLLTGARQSPLLHQALEEYETFGAIQVGWVVAGGASLLALLCAVGASVVPLVFLRRDRLEGHLRSGSPSATSRRADRARTGLVTAQVAFGVVLLTATALVVTSVRQIVNRDPGFATNQIVMAGIGIPEARYDTDQKMIDFHEQVIERLKRIPGVVAASGGAGLPTRAMSTRFLLPGDTTPEQERPTATVSVASPEMLSLLDIPLKRGRNFDVADRVGHPYVVLANETFVQRYLEGRDPLGATLRLAFWNGHGDMKPWSTFELVGVVGDTRNRGLIAEPEPGLYLSALQVPLEGFLYFARTNRTAGSLAHEFQEAVWSVDPGIQRVTPQPLARYVESELRTHRLVSVLLGCLTAIALLLVTAGMGAGLVLWVVESRKEFGIRAAVGAAPSRLVLHVLSRAAWTTALGLSIGIACTAALNRYVASLLPGLARLDPFTVGIVTAAFLVIAGVAACSPALRAAKTDPVHLLRQQ